MSNLSHDRFPNYVRLSARFLGDTTYSRVGNESGREIMLKQSIVHTVQALVTVCNMLILVQRVIVANPFAVGAR